MKNKILNKILMFISISYALIFMFGLLVILFSAPVNANDTNITGIELNGYCEWHYAEAGKYKTPECMTEEELEAFLKTQDYIEDYVDELIRIHGLDMTHGGTNE